MRFEILRSGLLAVALGGAVMGSSFGVAGCSARDFEAPVAGSSDGDDGSDPSGETMAREDGGQTSTSGAMPSPGDAAADVSSTDGGAADESSGAPADPCAGHLDRDQDPDQICGLSHVEFDPGSAVLSFGAACRLVAAAPCIAAARGILFLQAHAATDEGADEEGAILLSQARGEAVAALLAAEGVPGTAMQVIAKGNLRAADPATDADRRVELRW